MKERLIQTFHDAFKNYSNQTSRDYEWGFFSSLRHSFSKTEKISELEHALVGSTDDEHALSVIIEHFLSKDATFKHHSFNNYF